MKERLRNFQYAPWLLLLLGLVGVAGPFVWQGHVPGDLGDGCFNLCVLEHFYRACCGLEKSFVDGIYFYPWPSSMAFSDTFWGNGPIYVLLRFLRLEPMDAFCGWFLIGCVLNFAAAYYVFRKFGLKQWGAGVGAFMFTFCIPASSQFCHVQLTYRCGVPLGLFFLDRYLRTRKPLYLSWVLLVLALQTLATIYVSIFLGYLLLGWLVAWCISEKFLNRKRLGAIGKNLLPKLEAGPALWGALAVGLLAIGLLGFAFWPYLEVSRLYGFKRDWRIIKSMLPRPASYFLADLSRIWDFKLPQFDALPVKNEHRMFLGLGAILAILAATFRAKKFQNPAMLVLMRNTFFVVAGLTLCVFDQSLYWGIAQLPGFNAIRAVTRIVLVIAFPVGYLLGALVESLWKSKGQTAKICAACLVLFSIVEAVLVKPIRDTKANWAKRSADLEAELKKSLGRTVRKTDILVLAKSGGDLPDSIFYDPDAMLLAQRLGIKTLNGYSGNQPPAWRHMNSVDDVIDILVAAKKFRKIHHLPEVDINPDDLALVGFGNVDRAALSAALRSGPPVFSNRAQLSVGVNPREFSRYILGSGWAFNGDGSVLAIEPQVNLDLQLDQNRQARRIFLDMGAFLPTAASAQRVRVFANDTPLGGFTFTPNSNRSRYYLFLPDNLGSEVTLRLVCENPIAPPGAAESGSSVKVGVILFGIGREDLNP